MKADSSDLELLTCLSFDDGGGAVMFVNSTPGSFELLELDELSSSESDSSISSGNSILSWICFENISQSDMNKNVDSNMAVMVYPTTTANVNPCKLIRIETVVTAPMGRVISNEHAVAIDVAKRYRP